MTSPRSPQLGLVLLLAAVVLVIDQLTKVWALATLTEGERTPLIGDLLGLTLLFNPGAALSIATGMTWVLTLAAVAVTVVILRVAHRLGSRAWAVALGLLLGGAVGNLVDRLFREPGVARGHVVDFIAYGDLFVGNVADIAIVAAACLIVLLSLRGIGVDGSHASDAAQDTSGAPAGHGPGGSTAPDGDAPAPGAGRVDDRPGRDGTARADADPDAAPARSREARAGDL